MLIYRFLILIFVINISANCADTTSIKYFPMQPGSRYVYYVWTGFDEYRLVSEIVKDSVFNSHKYFQLLNFYSFSNGWYRTDSITGSLYKYSTSGSCLWGYDQLIDSLGAQGSGDFCIGHYGVNTIQYNVFGSQTTLLNFERIYGSFGHRKIYAKNFGFYDFTSFAMTNSSGARLQGCVINGVVYGDTSSNITGIVNYGNLYPAYFSLSQNYPNPFNPETIIKYEIPKDANVSIKIYDLSGREVFSVSEFKLPGSYEIIFDGSNLASGLYFYSIKAETSQLSSQSGRDVYTETKKMVLIK